MEKELKICQSCGIPLNNENRGTNKNLSPSDEYCLFCYQKGMFVVPDLSLDQQINRLTNMAVNNMGMTEEKARKMAMQTLPELKRWKVYK